MAKRKKEEKDIESYRHEDETRKNAVPVGPYYTSKSKSKKYAYDIHFSPHLVWSGNKEQTLFEGHTVAYALKLNSDRAIL